MLIQVHERTRARKRVQAQVRTAASAFVHAIPSHVLCCVALDRGVCVCVCVFWGGGNMRRSRAWVANNCFPSSPMRARLWRLASRRDGASRRVQGTCGSPPNTCTCSSTGSDRRWAGRRWPVPTSSFGGGSLIGRGPK